MDVIRTIRTSPQSTRRDIHARNPPESRTRLIAKIVREVAASEQFEDFASLKAALRVRLVALGVRYEPAEFDDAISVVQYSTRLVGPARPQPARAEVAPPREITRAEAADLVRQLPLKVRQMRSTRQPIDIYGPVPEPDWGDHDRY
jgi:hypothetical protein